MESFNWFCKFEYAKKEEISVQFDYAWPTLYNTYMYGSFGVDFLLIY